MKFCKYILYLSIIVLQTSCIEEIKDCKQTKDRAVLLINKTPHKKSATKTLLIDDKQFLDTICYTLFEYRKRITDVNVRDHRGFIEVIFAKDKKYYFDMVYTDYDGIVFRLNANLYYKNDSLVNLLESKFILPEK